MFQRNIRFHVEICTVKSNDLSAPDNYYVTFTLITGELKNLFRKNKFLKIVFFLQGQARRFKKLCEEIQTLFLTSKDRLAKQRRQTNDTRPINFNNIPSPPPTTATTTNRPNISFISSLFGTTNPSSKLILLRIQI
jgi:hypothetical protein